MLLTAQRAWHWGIFAAVVKGKPDFVTEERGMCLKRAITRARRGANRDQKVTALGLQEWSQHSGVKYRFEIGV